MIAGMLLSIGSAGAGGGSVCVRVWGLCSPLGLGCADMCTLEPVRVRVCEGLCTL